MKMQYGQLVTGAYFSNFLKPPEKGYSAHKLELMAINKAVIALKYYLCNTEFVILSHCKLLKCIKNNKSC